MDLLDYKTLKAMWTVNGLCCGERNKFLTRRLINHLYGKSHVPVVTLQTGTEQCEDYGRNSR